MAKNKKERPSRNTIQQIEVRRTKTVLFIALIALAISIAVDRLIVNGYVGLLEKQYKRAETFFIFEIFIFLFAIFYIALIFIKIQREVLVLRKIESSLSNKAKIKDTDVEAVLDELALVIDMNKGPISGKRTKQNLNYFKETGKPTSVHEVNAKCSEINKEEIESEFEYPRYCTWVVPIIGFIGTLYGITIAIQNFAQILSKTKQGNSADILISNLSNVSDGLSISFETTLPALLISGILALLLAILDRKADRFLWNLDSVQINSLIGKFTEGIDPTTRGFINTLSDIGIKAKELKMSTNDMANIQSIIQNAIRTYSYDNRNLSPEEKINILIENVNIINNKLPLLLVQAEKLTNNIEDSTKNLNLLLNYLNTNTPILFKSISDCEKYISASFDLSKNVYSNGFILKPNSDM